MERYYVYTSFLIMLAAYTFAYRAAVRPVLRGMDPHSVLQWLLLVHCGRAMGFISLMPGVTLPGYPPEAALPQAYGDVAMAAFAVIGAMLLHRNAALAIPWAWFTALWGAADLVIAGVQMARFDAAPKLGAMFIVIVWYVPLISVAHVVLFRRLLHRPAPGAFGAVR